MMKKRIWGILLALALCLSLLPTAALAEEESEEQGESSTTTHPHATHSCGESCSTHVAGDPHKDVNMGSGTAWSDAASLPDSSGYYYLTTDVTLSDTWTVPTGMTTLCLNGYKITGASGKNVIKVDNSRSFTLTDCSDTPGTITHSGGNGCGVQVTGGTDSKNSTFTMYGGSITGNDYSNNSSSGGGGVSVGSTGTFYMYGGTISGNTAVKGGGVYVENGGSFTMSGGTIGDNKATNYGGGVYILGVSGNNTTGGSFTMSGGTISGNEITGTTYSYGGGVCVGNGSFTMSGGTIGGTADGAGNTAQKGGGVYVTGYNATFTMTGGTISGNTATSSSTGYGGGGVCVDSGAVIMRDGSITGNNAPYGGGVYVNGGTFTMESNASISDNSASASGGGVSIPDGIFNMNGGSITGNNAASAGGGVNVAGGGFNMTDGSITGNKASCFNDSAYGGGVNVYRGTFTMSDGSITGNHATYSGTDSSYSAKGGGVYVNGQGLFYVSGAAKVENNTVASSTTNNVELNVAQLITVIGELTDGASIGVTTSSTPAAAEGETPAKSVVFAQGSASTDEGSAYQLKLADKGHFSYDKTGAYYIKLEEDNNQLTLNAGTEPHSHQWSYTLSDDDKTITATCVGTAGTCGLGSTAGGVSDKVGATYTLAAPTDLTYSNSEKEATVTCDVKSGTDLPTSLTITYKQGTTTLEGAPTDAGTYTASITVGGQTASVEYTIAAKSVTDGMIDMSSDDVTYNGSAFTPELTVKDGTTTLVKGTDYTVSYSNNKFVGMATATITGIGNYTGTVNRTFTIKADPQTLISSYDSEHPYSLTRGGNTVDLTGLVSDAKGTLRFTLDATTYATLDADGKTLRSTNSTGTVKITVDAAAMNVDGEGDNEYGESTLDIYVQVVDKKNASVSISRSINATYGTNFTLTAAAKDSEDNTLTGGSWNWNYPTDCFVAVDGTNSASITLKPLKATTSVQITAAYEDAQFSGTTSTGIVVDKKTLTRDDLTFEGDADDAITKVYDGTDTANATVIIKDSAKVNDSDTLPEVSGTYRYNTANVLTAHTVTFTSTETSNDNYVLPAGLERTKPGHITKAVLTAEGTGIASGTYGAKLSELTVSGLTAKLNGTDVSGTWKLSGDTVPNVGDSGTHTATFAPTNDIGNYNVLAKEGVTLTIAQAAARTLADIPVSQKYTVTSGEKVLGDVGMPTDAGALGYSKGSASTTGSVSVGTDWNVDSTGKVTYTLTGGAAGDIITLPVVIHSTNYADSTVNVVITLTDKDEQEALTINSASGTTVTYGQTLTLSTSGGSGTGAVTYEIVSGGTGAATIDGAVLTPTKAGTVQVKAIKAADTDYASVESEPVTITINKATPTGAPSYTAITASDKTLADANLTADGTFSVEGTVQWVDDSGAALADTTAVEANTTYKWLFTPTDSDNYNTIDGTVELWHKTASSSGSSSGGSSTITVPVSSDSATVQVKAEVSKGNATVSVSDAQIDKVAADGAGSVTVDVSGLKNVESATVPAHVVEKTNEAEGTGLTVALPAGSVALDETALESVTDAANGKDVTVSVVSVPTASLSPAVKDIIGMEPTVAAVVDVTVTVNGRKQSSFDGGKLTIRVPYVAKKGEDTSKLTVWFIRDDGTIENKGGWYDAKNKCFVFETDHLSQYLLVSTEQASRFVDVPTDKYFHVPVSWAVTNGITGGTDATHFSPYASCTRGQLVTFLWRAAGEPEAKTTVNPFSDVKETSAFYKAILWASENNIVGGYADGTFRPSQAVTRANAAAILFRFAAANGMDAVTLQELVSGYADASSVPAYAIPAFNWALATGVITGNNGSLLPQDTCTRAQIVTMLYRLLAK